MPRTPQTFRRKGHRHSGRTYLGSKQSRGYGGEWERISRMYRQQHPVCEICHAAPSEDCDHIVPFRGVNDPLRTDWNNLQAVCRSCHNRKTRARPLTRDRLHGGEACAS
jgi:5-methylcytosine-specific restriction protein A